MSKFVFFSWQSDRPSRIGRGLIETCLKDALVKIRSEAGIEEPDRDFNIDKDTLGVPGTPGIYQTILEKIDRSEVFVADLTAVALRKDGGLVPNPNVCIEFGYASSKLSLAKVINVMNIAFGPPDAEKLPFDLRHLRRPITYDCPEHISSDNLKIVRSQLTSDLARALKLILERDQAAVSAAEYNDLKAKAEVKLQGLAFDASRGQVPRIVSRPRLTVRLVPFASGKSVRFDDRAAVRLLGDHPLNKNQGAGSRVQSVEEQIWVAGDTYRIEGFGNSETAWLVRVVLSGAFETQVLVAKRIEDDTEIILDGRDLEGVILAQASVLIGMAQSLGLSCQSALNIDPA